MSHAQARDYLSGSRLAAAARVGMRRLGQAVRAFVGWIQALPGVEPALSDWMNRPLRATGSILLGAVAGYAFWSALLGRPLTLWNLGAGLACAAWGGLSLLCPGDAASIVRGSWILRGLSSRCAASGE